MASLVNENINLQTKLAEVQTAFEKNKSRHEMYREFIIERGLASEFILWRARKEGLDEEFVKSLEAGPQF